MKNKYSKYLFFAALIALIGAGGIMYYFTRNYHPYIFNLGEMAHNGDTVYCTLENYTTTHKSNTSHGVLTQSFNSKTNQRIVNQKVKFKFKPNAPTFLGFANGFVWYERNERLVLVYAFKKDSVLEEEASTKLLNTLNPNTQLANITYAPTRGVIYAQITTGDRFIINPTTFRYIKQTTEKASYNYALLPDTKIEGNGERLNVDSLELIFTDSKNASNQKKHIEADVYSANGSTYHMLTPVSSYKLETEFINPKFILYQNNIAILKHQNQIGDSAQLLITAINIRTIKIIWQQKINNLFKADNITDVKSYLSLNSNYFYLISDRTLPIKIHLITGNIKQ